MTIITNFILGYLIGIMSIGLYELIKMIAERIREKRWELKWLSMSDEEKDKLIKRYMN